MAMTVEDIASLLSREGSGLAPDEYDESVETDEARTRRTELLAPVLATCQQLWDSGSEELDLVAQKLGDGSRDGKHISVVVIFDNTQLTLEIVAWRVPFGDSGILSFFLEVNSKNTLRPALQVHTHRIIGNSCADTDENRARVAEGKHLAAIISRLKDDSLIPFTVPVLYNIMVDYG